MKWLNRIAQAALREWQIADSKYADGTPKALIIGKRATFIIATGGIYDAQTQMASFNFVEPHLRSLP
jgi:FMN-dependent NADH-azoreductase